MATLDRGDDDPNQPANAEANEKVGDMQLQSGTGRLLGSNAVRGLGRLVLGAIALAAIGLAAGEASAQLCLPGEWDNQGICETCPCGHYCPGDDSRKACAAGSANPLTGSSDPADCSLCNAGFFSLAGSCACTACAPGFFQSLPGSSTCNACGPGQYQPNSGSTACLDCAPGSFNDQPASPSCEPCGPGRYESNPGSSACSACTAGSYASGSGNTACTDCEPGSFQGQTGSETCEACAEGQYQPDYGGEACFACACDDANACTIDSCDMIDGSCTYAPNPQCGAALPALPVGGLVLCALGIAGAALFALRRRES